MCFSTMPFKMTCGKMQLVRRRGEERPRPSSAQLFHVLNALPHSFHACFGLISRAFALQTTSERGPTFDLVFSSSRVRG